MRLGFSKLVGTLSCGKICIYLLRVHLIKSEKDIFDDDYAIVCLYKGICCGYSFELHRQVDAIQMSTHNIYLYTEVYKKYTGCNLKSTELLDCAVIRLNKVFLFFIINVFLTLLVVCKVNISADDT